MTKKNTQTPTEAMTELAQTGAAIDVDGHMVRLNPNIATWREDVTADKQLMRSIKEQGQIQPIVFRAMPDGSIELIAGHRRFEAMRALKVPFDKMNVIIKQDVSDVDAVLMAINENMERKDLNQVELARSYKALADLGLTTQQIADKLHMGESTVRERLGLLELPAEIQKRFLAEKIPYSCLRSLVKLNDHPKEQLTVAKEMAGESGYHYGKWSAQEAEKTVNEVLKTIADRKRFAEKYGPCPHCNHGIVKKSDSWEKYKAICMKCGFTFDVRTRMPWTVSQIQEQAQKIGLKAEVKLDEKAIELKPEEVAKITEEQMEKVRVAAEITPTLRAVNTVDELANFIVKSNGVLSFTVDDNSISVKLAENTGLSFSAHPHDYNDGTKTKVTVIEGWQENDKLTVRKPKVEQFLASASEQIALNPAAIGEVQCVSCEAWIPYKHAIPYREKDSLTTEMYCGKCAVVRGIILNVPDEALTPKARKEREQTKKET